MNTIKGIFTAMLLSLVCLISCDGEGSLSDVEKETYTADAVSFSMVYVPGGLTFPTGVNDDGTATVDDAFWIGETEVTYELWKKVLDWAITDAGDGKRVDGGELYCFANMGRKGNDGAEGKSVQHPVTMVNWRDCMVWCNALTEWYNAQKGAGYECVYTYYNNSGPESSGPEIIRDSRDTNATACDEAMAGSVAKGFRLLMSNEYELAARYRNGVSWTYGDHASGDESGYCYTESDPLGGMSLSTVFGSYSVYSENSGSSTAEVKSKTANALGLYCMSGNIWEWCFDFSGIDFDGTFRVIRGASWDDPAGNLRVGIKGDNYSHLEHGIIGFRFARTAQ